MHSINHPLTIFISKVTLSCGLCCSEIKHGKMVKNSNFEHFLNLLIDAESFPITWSLCCHCGGSLFSVCLTPLSSLFLFYCIVCMCVHGAFLWFPPSASFCFASCCHMKNFPVGSLLVDWWNPDRRVVSCFLCGFVDYLSCGSPGSSQVLVLYLKCVWNVNKCTELSDLWSLIQNKYFTWDAINSMQQPEVMRPS